MTNKITYSEMAELFIEHNNALGLGVGNQFDERGIYAVIVFAQSNFNKPYTEEQRSYKVISTNKRFLSGMIGNSIFGDCLDGSDLCVRLDYYNWKVDYCYML